MIDPILRALTMLAVTLLAIILIVVMVGVGRQPDVHDHVEEIICLVLIPEAERVQRVAECLGPSD